VQTQSNGSSGSDALRDLVKETFVNLIRPAVRGLGALALAALIGSSLTARAAGPPVYSTAPGISLANLDPSCKACDDFFQYATGGWEKAHPIPAAYPSWGTFNLLNDDNQKVLHGILDAAAADTAAKPGSNEAKIGAYYRACMDTDAIEKAGLTPIQPALDAIATIDSPAKFALVGAQLDNAGYGGFLYGLGSQADQKDSAKQLVALSVGGLGLPDKDYYLSDDERFKTIRTAYVGYITTILGTLNDANAATDAQNILAFETELAKERPARADLRDPAKTYHPTPFATLATELPGVDWTAFVSDSGAPVPATINVTLPDTISASLATLKSTPVETLRAYARFHLIDAFAPALPQKFVDANFAFRGTVLSGTTQQLDRWKRCARGVDAELGEALGQVYVEQAFSPAAKARALALVDNLQAVLGDDIAGLPWMSASTKTYAEKKLAAYHKKIGYPDKFRDYSPLTFGNGPFASDLVAARVFDHKRLIARMDKPTDRAEWGMTPPTVNAYYNPPNNEIVFPAGILHPPFFSDQNDDAVNYGAIGAVIGHEMTHGFDDQGRHYDANGNITDWWTAADAAAFSKRAQCIVDEFDGFTVAPGVHEQGRLVQGEAIADLGGITIAYKAFERTPEFKAHKKIDGFTPEQRFFLAYAQVWAGEQREAAAVSQAKSDPHPEGKYRVIGTLSNMPEFRAAFHCLATDPMVRKDSCQIW
jgi:putative endopeptidase